MVNRNVRWYLRMYLYLIILVVLSCMLFSGCSSHMTRKTSPEGIIEEEVDTSFLIDVF